MWTQSVEDSSTLYDLKIELFCSYFLIQHEKIIELQMFSLQMLLIPNALCCSLNKHNCVCAVTKFLLPVKNFFPTSAGNAQAQLHFAGNAQAQLNFRDDQQRAFGMNNISN